MQFPHTQIVENQILRGSVVAVQIELGPFSLVSQGASAVFQHQCSKKPNFARVDDCNSNEIRLFVKVLQGAIVVTYTTFCHKYNSARSSTSTAQ